MRRCRTPALVSIAIVALGGCTESFSAPTSPVIGGALAAKTPPPTSINVTTTIYDTDASGNALLMRSDDSNGSGFASYTTVSARSGSMTSHLTSDGGWQLLLDAQSTRTLYLVLASQGIAGVPDGYYYSSVEAYARCFDGANTRVSILSMASGASNGNCTLGLDFSSGRTKYKLAMGPDYDAASPTGRATVTCTAAANGSCTSWTVAANPTTATTFTLTNGQIVSAPPANLYMYANGGGLTFMGSYHNSYSITAAE